MKWRGGRRSKNVEDRRGGRYQRSSRPQMRMPRRLGRRTRRGGGGLIGILVIVGIGWALGMDPIALLSQQLGGGGFTSDTRQHPQIERSARPINDDINEFISVVLAQTEQTWGAVFEARNRAYDAPRLVLFSGRTNSRCGTASSQTGPFYCPGDQSIYIDPAFYEQMRAQLNAPGDFAQAYVIAHEVGHHIQELTGILPEFNRARARLNGPDINAYSVRVELQADCYAGVWAQAVNRQGLMEVGDLDEALNAARQIGDDALQSRAGRTPAPKTFTHGTSAQRRAAFQTGFDATRIDACDLDRMGRTAF